MIYLLDTHIFLWMITDSPKLTSKVKNILLDNQNRLLFSAASAWEIVIKSGLEKLNFFDKPEKFIPEQLMINNIEVLPIQISHALNINNLPLLHKDPFDRIIISQAQIEKIPILSADKMIQQYDIKVIF